MIIGQGTVGCGIDMTYLCVPVYLVDALAIGRYQQSAVRLLGGVQHYRALTAMLPHSCLGVQNADTIVGTHQQQMV